MSSKILPNNDSIFRLTNIQLPKQVEKQSSQNYSQTFIPQVYNSRISKLFRSSVQFGQNEQATSIMDSWPSTEKNKAHTLETNKSIEFLQNIKQNGSIGDPIQVKVESSTPRKPWLVHKVKIGNVLY